MVTRRLEKVSLSRINQKAHKNLKKLVAYSPSQMSKTNKQIKILRLINVVNIAKKSTNLNSAGDKK